mmetsp:Transcript_1986/g.5650  ORF Transcript_1986/g.5650 Transcript_1986/m.5650 type:complete len:205 (-) Transcript_1986:621-1235(-)
MGHVIPHQRVLPEADNVELTRNVLDHALIHKEGRELFPGQRPLTINVYELEEAHDLGDQLPLLLLAVEQGRQVKKVMKEALHDHHELFEVQGTAVPSKIFSQGRNVFKLDVAQNFHHVDVPHLLRHDTLLQQVPCEGAPAEALCFVCELGVQLLQPGREMTLIPSLHMADTAPGEAGELLRIEFVAMCAEAVLQCHKTLTVQVL